MEHSLLNVEPEDVEEVIRQAEISFGIEFGSDSFLEVKTFGDVVDVIKGKIDRRSSDACTYQQAFYKIRRAFSEIGITAEIRPGTELSAVMCATKRRRIAQSLDKHLGFKTDILNTNGYTIIAFLLVVVSLVLAFRSVVYLCVGGFGSALLYLMTRFQAPVLRVRTVGDLARKISWEHYTSARRDSDTVNYQEFETIITDWFSTRLGLEKSELKRDSAIV